MYIVSIVVQLLLMSVLAYIFYVTGLHYFSFLIIPLWITVIIQKSVVESKQTKILETIGYDKNPVVPSHAYEKFFKKCLKEKTCKSIYVYRLKEYEQSDDWNEIITLYNQLKSNVGLAKLGFKQDGLLETIESVRRWFVSPDNEDSWVVICAMKSGQYRFIQLKNMTPRKNKKLAHLLNYLLAIEVLIYADSYKKSSVTFEKFFNN